MIKCHQQHGYTCCTKKNMGFKQHSQPKLLIINLRILSKLPLSLSRVYSLRLFYIFKLQIHSTLRVLCRVFDTPSILSLSVVKGFVNPCRLRLTYSQVIVKSLDLLVIIILGLVFTSEEDRIVDFLREEVLQHGCLGSAQTT